MTNRQTTYIWEGADREGRAAKGELEAPTPRHARAQLRRRGVVVKRLRRKRRSASVGKRVTAREIALFSRQLATLTRAGVHLVQALRIVADNTRNPRFARLVASVGGELAGGASLAVALAAHPRQFDDVYRHLVHVGEQSGALDAMLERIAGYQERAEGTRRKVRKALTYPATVVVAALVVTALLLIHIVPQFEAVFATAGAQLPAFTRLVIALSDGLRAWWPAVVVAVAAGGGALALLRRRSVRWRDAMDAVYLKTPLTGPILVKAGVARCARTLACAAASGVPLVDALGAVAGSAGNATIASAMRGAGEQVAAGRPLSAGLRDAAVFPELFAALVAVGEESGNLDEMLGKCADIYEGQVEDAVDNLTTLIEPMLIGVLGVVIGGLIVAMYLPVFRLGSVFGGG